MVQNDKLLIGRNKKTLHVVYNSAVYCPRESTSFTQGQSVDVEPTSPYHLIVCDGTYSETWIVVPSAVPGVLRIRCDLEAALKHQISTPLWVTSFSAILGVKHHIDDYAFTDYRDLRHFTLLLDTKLVFSAAFLQRFIDESREA